MFVPTPVQPPESPRVRELSQRIQDVIRDFQRQYPMTSAEIRQALWHAGGSTGTRRPALVAAVAGGVAAILGVGVFVSRGAEPPGGGTFPIMMVAAVVAGLMAVVVAIRRSH